MAAAAILFVGPPRKSSPFFPNTQPMPVQNFGKIGSGILEISVGNQTAEEKKKKRRNKITRKA